VIVTVTPNPSLDLTYVLAPADSLGRNDIEVHRAESVTLEASGKGVNVTRALALAAVPSVAVYPAGGPTGQQLTDLLAAAGVAHRAVLVCGATRVNTTVLQPSAATTKVNAPGAALSRAEIADLLAATCEVLSVQVPVPGGPDGDRSWLAVCGSLPPETDPELVGDLVRLAHARGVRCAVDSSGAPLKVALAAGADLLAPNVAELAQVSDVLPEARGDELARAVAHVAAEHQCELLVSLGADGALWTDGNQVVHARGEAVIPVNTAGAGDALLAGWLAGAWHPAESTRQRLQRAVAWGRAACLSPTTVAALPPPPGPG
jgi:1-phosphofructokinase